MIAVANEYGTVDVRQGVPAKYVHVAGKRLGPVCRRLGIKFAAALTGWEKSRYGYKPILDGVVVSPRGAVKLQAHLARRKPKTPEQQAADRRRRELARDRRQERDADDFAARIREQYPRMPDDDVRDCARHATVIGSGRVGRSTTAEDPVTAAVVAYARHNCTDYDDLIGETRDREYARWMIDGDLAEIIRSWEADS